MVAVRIHGFGGLDELHLEELPIPQPRHEEVLIHVAAIGISPMDCRARRGEVFTEALTPLPAVLGWEVSGTVASVGARVTDFVVGDEVFGLLNYPGPAGGYAEYVTAAAGELVRIPAGVSHGDAAALPLSGPAAWQSLFEVGKATSGHRLLVHGAAGGVGHIAVQLAKWKGATVVASASARNLEYLGGIGADEVVDYTADRAFENVNWVDLIIDSGGCEDNPELMQSLVRWGRHVVLCGKRTPSPRLEYFTLRPDTGTLEQVAELVAAGELRLNTTLVPGLEGIAQAHSMSESGHVRGKIVVTLR
jgi:NADPH:quinone reductase-like Zn-dependent oxidoreductase